MDYDALATAYDATWVGKYKPSVLIAPGSILNEIAKRTVADDPDALYVVTEKGVTKIDEED